MSSFSPSAGSTGLSLRYSALSDVGRVRKDNQDAAYASERLLVVADGVGGAVRGDLASSTAVQMLRRLDATGADDLLPALAGAVQRVHDRIGELVEEDPALQGTSTTVTAALFDGHRIGLAHVGDSRAYLWRDGTLSQLTRDHTFVQGLVDEGRITEEESRVHPHRNLILRAVDGIHEADPDLSLVDLAPGDRLLLCSDGCSGVLDGERIAAILGSGTVDYAAVELVRASLEAGSTDNVTCVVAEVIDAAAAAAGASDPETSAAFTTGPMLVGAAETLPRPGGPGGDLTGATHQRRAATGASPDDRDDDTGELDPVPTGQSSPTRAPADPEELRYAPRPPRRFLWLRRAAVLLALALVVVVAAGLAYRWTQTQYYVAADGDNVAIYRGVEADLPGLTLSSVHEDSGVTLASLPDHPAAQVGAGINAESLDDARDIVANLGDLVRVCPEPEPTPSPSRSPRRGSTTDADPSAGPSAGPSPRSPTPSGPTASTPTASAPTTDGPGDGAELAPPECVEATP